MKAVLAWAACAVLTLACALQGHAQDDLSGDDLQIVSAVYGSGDRFEDVTARVNLLLDGQGFYAHTDELHTHAPQSDENTLIIVYNYGGKRHFFYRRSTQHRLSAGLLKEEAKLDESHDLAAPETPAPDDGVKVIFAIYGLRGNFAEVTDSVVKQLHDSPAINLPGATAFGVDPAPGGPKSVVIIYDVAGARHIYATKDDGPPITVTRLTAMAKASPAR